MKIEEKLKQKINRIKLVIMDVDGVLTDGKIVYGENLGELKFFNVKDGYGVVLLNKAGIKTAIISAGNKDLIEKRAKDMKVSFVYCTENKLDTYRNLKKKLNIDNNSICYIGDDLLDMPVIEKVGFSACVSDATEDVKNNVDYIAHVPGGEGAVREIVEMILKTKNLWEDVIKA